MWSSFFKWANSGLFLICFRLYKHTLQILQQIGMWQNVLPVYTARIQTHNFWHMSLLPYPLDQGSRWIKSSLSLFHKFLSLFNYDIRKGTTTVSYINKFLC